MKSLARYFVAPIGFLILAVWSLFQPKKCQQVLADAAWCQALRARNQFLRAHLPVGQGPKHDLEYP